jgi:tetratricopeptide (TPR) repeat protein
MLKAALSCCRQWRSALAAVFLVVSLGGFAPSAEAGDNSSRATAKAHYETATRLYEIREYDKALLEYKSAYLAQPDAAFLFNIGQCYRKLGQNQEALNFFQEYLKKASPDDPNRRKVEARIRDIEAETKLKAQAAEAAAAPAPAPAPPPAPPPAPAPAPTSEVAQPVPTPPLPAVVAPPPPAVEIPPAAVSVEQASPVSAAPSVSGRGLRIAGITCGVAGLVSMGIAVYYYTRARSLSDSVTNSTNSKASASDDQAGRDAQTMQWVFYSIGAGALATGTLLYLLGWPSAETGRTVAGVTPMVGPGLAGISAQGTF